MIFSTEMAIEGNEIKVIDEEIIYTLGKFHSKVDGHLPKYMAL